MLKLRSLNPRRRSAGFSCLGCASLRPPRYLKGAVKVTHKTQDLFGASYVKEPAPSREPLSREERLELDRLVRTLSQYSCWRLEREQEVEAEEEAESAPTELFTASATALFDRRRPTASDFEQAAQLIAQWPHNRQLDTSRTEV